MVEGIFPRDTASLRFAGFTLDLAGCALTDPKGNPVELTRGEFVMLRTFAQLPGRVLSRDALLDAVAGRRGDAFDRSVDMMVGRLRRKIEADPKQPRLIATVPGMGYKFCPPVTSSYGGLIAMAEPGTATVAPTPPQPGRRLALVGGGVVLGFAALAADVAWLACEKAADARPPTITLLPFANISGDPTQDYFAEGVAQELSMQLGTFPALQVIAAPTTQAVREQGPIAAARGIGADYALGASLSKGANRVRITAQLFETKSGAGLWSDQFDATGADLLAMQEDIAERINSSLSGYHGVLYQARTRESWRKATPSLAEYDYAVRGHAYYFRFTKADVLKAREIWIEGLRRFPGSALLRTKVAMSHMWMFMNSESEDIEADVADAWELIRQSEEIEPRSPLVAYLNQWTRAIVRQWRGEDFAGSLLDAREALRTTPYDTLLRMDVSWCMANAGLAAEAVDHALWALQHTPNPPGWFFSNLGWAYYMAGRYPEALEATRKAGDSSGAQVAMILVRLGRLDEARAAVAGWRALHPTDSVAAEARWPLVEPFKAALLQDLRAAGLPET